MHTDWSSLSLWFFYLWWFWLTFNKNPPIYYLNKLEYFIRPITYLVNCWPSGKCVHLLYMYSILGRGSFALITASIRRGMEVISLWHCWGGMKPRFLWLWPSAHLNFLVSCFSFSSWQYSRDSLCSGLVSLLASQAHQHHSHLTNFWCFWQCGQVPNPAGKWNQHL